MKWVKLHLLVIVLMVQATALFWERDEPLPYFPIEISRTAATGVLNRWLFLLAILSLGVTLHLRRLLERYRLVWIALLFLAWFDDKHHPLSHQISVGLLFLGLIHALSQDLLPGDEKSRLRHAEKYAPVIFGAAAIYVARVVMKVLVVLLFELETYGGPLVILERVMTIMHHGSAVCLTPWVTINVFRLCGVMQWLVFGLLAREMH